MLIRWRTVRLLTRTVRHRSPMRARYGKPKTIVSDNGTELTSNAILRSADDHKVARLKKLLADAMLDNAALSAVRLHASGYSPNVRRSSSKVLRVSSRVTPSATA